MCSWFYILEWKKIGRIRMIFDIENWLWMSEFCDLHDQFHNWALIFQRPFKSFKVRKCLFHKSRVWCGSFQKILKWNLILTYTQHKLLKQSQKIIKKFSWIIPMCTNVMTNKWSSLSAANFYGSQKAKCTNEVFVPFSTLH